MVTSLIVIDLSAAFNTIDHQILLDVLLNQYGVEGSTLAWFDTYLQPRRFHINVHGAIKKYLRYGVAQGSFGGPILYTAYASTLQYLLDPDVGLDLKRFAGDHSINKRFNPNGEEEETSTKSLKESSLANINTWRHENHLKINTSKTDFVCFSSIPQLAKCV